MRWKGWAWRIAGSIWLAAAVFTAASAYAELPREVLHEFGIRQPDTSQERGVAALQTDLAWIGLFQDRIDGQFNRSTRKAIGAFLESVGKPSGQRLSDQDRKILSQRAQQTIRAAGFRDTRFEWTGTSARLPSNFLRRPQIHGSEHTHIWINGKGSSGLNVEFYRYDLDEPAPPRIWLEAMADAQKNEDGDLDLVNKGVVGSTVFLSFRRDGLINHHIHQLNGSKVRGIALNYDEATQYSIQPILSEILGSVELFNGPAVPMSQIRARIRSGDYPGGRDLPDWYRGMVGSGSGSIVSYEGHILTNHHVVSGCARLTVNGQDAVLLGSDIRVDLALVRSPAFAGRTPIKFRNDGAVLGETVFVMGYPVFDVSQSINLTNGIVSSTVGLQGGP